MNQHKTLGILAVSAVLAAGLLGTGKPVAASGLTQNRQFAQPTLIADHDGDRNFDDNHSGNSQREERRREEIRREQFQREERRRQELRREQIRREELHREFQNGHRDRGDFGDRHDDRDNQHNDNRDNRDFSHHDDNR